MDVSVVIVEQLELEGLLRSFRMKASHGDQVTIAFADEYDEPRTGPFHFLNKNHEEEFARGFAECSARKLTVGRYRQVEGSYEFNSSWQGIPTEQGRLSYYAISLPEFAVPLEVRFSDPRSNRQFRKSVARDDSCNRFVLYLECRSSHGSFDFALMIRFVITNEGFSSATYHDETTIDHGTHAGIYENLLDGKEQRVVQQFFAGAVYMGDRYEVGQAGVVGRHAHADNSIFHQAWKQNSNEINLPNLAEELNQLRQALRAEGATLEQDKALAAVAAAEEAAKQNDGGSVFRHLRDAGKWALGVATKIGTTVAAKAIAKALGI